MKIKKVSPYTLLKKIEEKIIGTELKKILLIVILTHLIIQVSWSQFNSLYMIFYKLLFLKKFHDLFLSIHEMGHCAGMLISGGGCYEIVMDKIGAFTIGDNGNPLMSMGGGYINEGIFLGIFFLFLYLKKVKQFIILIIIFLILLLFFFGSNGIFVLRNQELYFWDFPTFSHIQQVFLKMIDNISLIEKFAAFNILILFILYVLNQYFPNITKVILFWIFILLNTIYFNDLSNLLFLSYFANPNDKDINGFTGGFYTDAYGAHMEYGGQPIDWAISYVTISICFYFFIVLVSLLLNKVIFKSRI